ncbi:MULTISPECIES: hypothetical protein [unclassified Rhizobium]|uniref:hypothetical protein n=1 Tax=unclassified Rhizobium TaxID=2613769 RepID=UPI00071256C1|nr:MULTISPECIES: hypothetical protein [unclassified Rhizobium]KQS84761.1 hypothetical protein ASG50_29650 [Rhizobium sp. Leaf386]KQT05288.1 hypothetical protein ASG42_20380 [Rhizobium sp. Leaf391]KQT91730.1 hypothetical protein ASG68_18030 [Rhizobium sp. Leaf453]
MFGMSVFQSVLERLKAEEDEEEAARDEQAVSPSIRGLNAGFVGNVTPSAGLADSSAVQRAYFDMAGDDMLAPPKPLPAPVMPDHLKRVRPDEIATDLGIAEGETLQSLADKRRTFAADNHPDRHHPDFRANATMRMKIANMLIDEALRRLRIARVA